MICEHGNDIDPKIAKQFCKMPPSFYARVSRTIDPDVCLFVTEKISIENAMKETKGSE